MQSHSTQGTVHAATGRAEDPRQAEQRLMEELSPVRGAIRVAYLLNAGALLVLWVYFRFAGLFSDVEQPFLSPLAWYFFFGLIFDLFAYIFFNFSLIYYKDCLRARVQNKNQRYKWHSRYDTDLTEEQLKEIPKAQQDMRFLEISIANSAEKMKRVTVAMIFLAFAGFVIGLWQSLGTLF